MSRIGRKAITLPSGVTVTISDTGVVVSGAKGQLTVPCFADVIVSQEEGALHVERKNDQRQTKANHGLVRSLLNNAVHGVSEGYKITLKLIGTGYRVTMKGAALSLALGFSHPVDVPAVTGVKMTIEGNDTIYLESIDKQLLGQVAANIRKLKPPEPYKGKGIRYEDEVVRRKQGKAAA